MQPNILFFHNSWEDLTRNCGNSPLKVSHQNPAPVLFFCRALLQTFIKLYAV